MITRYNTYTYHIKYSVDTHTHSLTHTLPFSTYVLCIYLALSCRFKYCQCCYLLNLLWSNGQYTITSEIFTKKCYTIHQYMWHETAHIFFKLFSFFKLNMWQNLLYCNGQQQHLAVRQPAKPMTSQLLLCQCLWVKGTDHQNLLMPLRKETDSVVWKSVEVSRNETALYKTSVQRRTGSLLMESFLTETEG